MKGIHSVVILFVATLAALTLGQSPKIPTECPPVDPMNTTIHLAHETDCTKFYMCLRGNKIEMQCPFMDKNGNRLHFNPELQVCDWPYRAGCQSGTTTTPPTTTTTSSTSEPPSTTTSTTTSTITITGSTETTSGITATTLTPTPSSTITDSTTTIVISPSTTQKTTEVTPSTITPEMPTTPPTRTPPTTTPKPVPTPKPSECPKDTNGVTIKIPHETICNYYYLCTDGEKVIQKCPGERVFNPAIHNCDFPENAVCSGTTLTPSTEPVPGKCPPRGSDKLPHECTCDRYYECRDGDAMLYICPPGLQYDWIRKVCDHPSIVKCDRPIPPTTTTPGTTVSYDECSPQEEGKKYEDEYSCTDYYECVNQRKVLKHCAPGLHFNYTLQMCDFPDKDCTKFTPTLPSSPTTITTIPPTRTTSTTPIPITTTTESPSNDVCPKGSREKLPHECSCTLYYQCFHGLQVVRHCQPGQEYDKLRKICDDPEVVKCSQPTPPESTTPTKSTESTTPTTPAIDEECPDDDDKIVKFPDKTDCTLYYECDHGKKVPQHCRVGHVFNPRLGVCDFPENVKECNHVSVFPAVSTNAANVCPPAGSSEKLKLPHECFCTKYYVCRNGEQLLQACPAGLEYDYKSGRCDKPEIVKCAEPIPPPPARLSSCAGKRDGTKVSNPSDCASYYVCYSGRKIPGTCYNGLLFNPILGLCDFPENVHCGTTTPDPSEHTCPSEGVDKIPSEGTDCRYYYDCDDGEKTLRKCPRNNHFNPQLKLCDFPENYPCDSDENEDIRLYDPSDCIGECPPDNPVNYTILLPHKDCHKFCMCANGIAFEQNCPEPLLYDYLREVCDYESKAKCYIPPQRILMIDENQYQDMENNYIEKDEDDVGEEQESSWFSLPIWNRYI